MKAWISVYGVWLLWLGDVWRPARGECRVIRGILRLRRSGWGGGVVPGWSWGSGCAGDELGRSRVGGLSRSEERAYGGREAEMRVTERLTGVPTARFASEFNFSAKSLQSASRVDPQALQRPERKDLRLIAQVGPTR